MQCYTPWTVFLVKIFRADYFSGRYFLIYFSMTSLPITIKSVEKNVFHTDDSVYGHYCGVRPARTVEALDKRMALGVSIGEHASSVSRRLLSLKLDLKSILIRSRSGNFLTGFSK